MPSGWLISMLYEGHYDVSVIRGSCVKLTELYNAVWLGL